MEKQTLNWLKNNETNKPKPHKTYVIKTNWRQAVAYWQRDEDGLFHWMSTEGHSYCDTVVSEFAEI